MAYGITNYFEGGTKEQYETTIGTVHPPEGLPVGQTHHFAGSTGDGWMVVAIWNSREDWEKFRDETLIPGLQSAEGALPGPPKETDFEIHNQQVA
jgi:hypothetical protein